MSEIPTHPSGSGDARREFKAVLAMSLPIVISTCSPLVMRVSDFAFVATLGTEAQAAIIPAQIVLWCYVAFAMGLVTAVNTFASQSLGRGRLRDCGAYAWQSLYLSAVLGVCGLGLWFLFPVIFRYVGHEPAVQQMELLYTRISVWGILPTVAAQALGSFFNGLHRPRATMMAALESNALNIFLNYALIFGAFGFPELGFAGAAWGTLVAAVYQTARLMATLWWGEARHTYASRETWPIDWPKIRALCRVGLPQGLQWFSEVTVWGVFNAVLIGRFGTVELAATNVAWQYIRIGFMPMVGVGQAISSMVGKAIGQHDRMLAIRYARSGAVVTFIYVGALSTLYLVQAEWLVGLFSDDPVVIDIGTKIMYCVAMFQLFDVLGQVYYHALRGAGDTTWPMIMMTVSHWTVVVGGGAMVVKLKPEWGSLGPWVVATVLISLSGLLLWWRWRSRAWMKINIFEPQQADEPESKFCTAELRPDAPERASEVAVAAVVDESSSDTSRQSAT